MTPQKKESWPRFLIFIALLCAAVFLANTFLIRLDAASYMTLHEMKTRSDIELALVGSSVVRNQFNPELISGITGRETFNVALPCLGMQGSLAAISMLYDTNSPEWTVLIVEHDTFCIPVELPDAQERLMPQLTGPLRRLRYYLDLCSQDGEYFNRLFLFKRLHVESFSDLKKTLSLRFDPDGYLERHPGLVSGTDVYQGHGFVRMELTEDIPAFLRDQHLTPDSFQGYDQLTAYSKQKLLEYKALCERNGSRPLVIFSPNLTARSLAEPSFVSMKKSVAAFLDAQGIPFFDFSLAKPELMENLDPYYLDYFHVNAEGADVLSAAFARFFTLYASGEDVSGLFYPSQDAYLETIDFITNIYADLTYEGGDALVTAGCNHGPAVTPLYRFVLERPNGSQTVLSDYSAENTCRVPRGALSGNTIRVFARPAGSSAYPPVYDELTAW